MTMEYDDPPAKAEVLRGCAALTEALDLIGEPIENGDRELARVVVNHEMALRNLLWFTMYRLTREAKV
jgi:hypothetical protein